MKKRFQLHRRALSRPEEDKTEENKTETAAAESGAVMTESKPEEAPKAEAAPQEKKVEQPLDKQEKLRQKLEKKSQKQEEKRRKKQEKQAQKDKKWEAKHGRSKPKKAPSEPKPPVSLKGLLTKLRERPSMRESLKRKWTAFLMLLVLCVLCIVGVFLLSATVNYYINEFRSEVGTVFTTDLLQDMNTEATGDPNTAATALSEMVEAYSGALGIGSGREYYILNSETGECLATSNASFDGTPPHTTNIVRAMNGKIGESIPLFGETMDIAIPIQGDSNYVLSIIDDRSDMHHMCWLMFMVIIAALVVGLFSAAALSMVLIRTVTDPIAELNEGAKRIMQGDYDQVLLVHDPDEIGELTESFNEMSAFVRRSIRMAELERVRMQAVTGYLKEGILSINPTGEITEMNAAAQQLLECPFVEGLTFAAVFPNLTFPDASRGIIQMVMQRGIQRLRLVFVADSDHGFTVLVIPMEELS